MQSHFLDFPDSSKVYLYPSSRKFYPQELDQIQKDLDLIKEKVNEEGWTENFDLKLIYGRFIIGVSEISEPGNLSKLANFLSQEILKLEQSYQIQLLDKMNVSFKQGQYIQYKDLAEFKKLIKNKAVNAKTIVFDNLVETLEDLNLYWEVPLEESWYSRML